MPKTAKSIPEAEERRTIYILDIAQNEGNKLRLED